mmetsp:Transcript_7420/g.10942  ORF Transcript_7420/g.10942 Transcript_7420/m.10942 type:complete len:80 (-) Transcript_7420:36-275(-)
MILRRFARRFSNQFKSEQEIVKKRFEKEQERTQQVDQQPNSSAFWDDKGSDRGEYGFRVRGPEPTRYGDWERKGRVTDF